MNEKLLEFIEISPTAFHAVDNVKSELKQKGFYELCEGKTWDIEKGKGYFVSRNNSSLIAFKVPESDFSGFMIAASHSDSPAFKIKENPDVKDKFYARLSVEKYGGMLIAPWLDRPLSLAGRALVETESGVESRLVNIDRDLLLIPNVAIHMNRKANDGYTWNPVSDTIPLLGGKDAQGKFQQLLEAAAGGKVLGHDLYLYIRQKSTVWGLEEEFISAPALDDLQCAWGCTQGFLNAKESGSVPVLCVFDSEEVGSSSVQGAASMLLQSTLERICRICCWSLEQMLSASFMVSADNAHALHPNHPELADATNRPIVGSGVVLKFNASQRYTTDAVSAAIFRKVCAKANVPVQTYYNRPDIPGGGTLGHISLAHVSIPTADIGLPQLAMHSCYETAGTHDSLYLEEAMACYYSQTLRCDTDGSYCLA